MTSGGAAFAVFDDLCAAVMTPPPAPEGEDSGDGGGGDGETAAAAEGEPRADGDECAGEDSDGDDSDASAAPPIPFLDMALALAPSSADSALRAARAALLEDMETHRAWSSRRAAEHADGDADDVRDELEARLRAHRPRLGVLEEADARARRSRLDEQARRFERFFRAAAAAARHGDERVAKLTGEAEALSLIHI